MTDESSKLARQLGFTQGQVEQLIASFDKLVKTVEHIDIKVDKLDNWRHWVMGGAAVIAVIVSVIVSAITSMAIKLWL